MKNIFSKNQSALEYQRCENLKDKPYMTQIGGYDRMDNNRIIKYYELKLKNISILHYDHIMVLNEVKCLIQTALSLYT